MNSTIPVKAIASVFALAGFAIALLAGLGVGNPASHVLFTGLVAMVLCFVVGSVAASVLARVVREHLAPVPQPASERVNNPLGAEDRRSSSAG